MALLQTLRDVRLLYLRELRAALRERTIVVNSLLMPLLLYPVLLWLILSAFAYVAGQEERLRSRVAFDDPPPVHAALGERLRDDEAIERVAPPADPETAIQDGELDAVARFLPAAPDGAALLDNFRLELLYDASKDRSARARRRLEETLEDYRATWLEQHAAELGLDADAWREFHLERRNLASESEMGGFVLGLLAPLLMVLMIAVGCFHPAIDATAGERERGTWETLLGVAASRSSIVWAKYLYVATMGSVAGLLNLFALALSLRLVLAPLLGEGAGAISFDVGPAALALLALTAVLLALFLAAGMMLFAAFARTFKEGQSMVAPFYMLSILPPLLVQSPDLALTPMLALVPIANVTLLFRAALTGVWEWPLVALTLLAQTAVVVVCLAAARYVLRFEDVLIGSVDGSLWRFLRRRLGRAETAS